MRNTPTQQLKQKTNSAKYTNVIVKVDNKQCTKKVTVKVQNKQREKNTNVLMKVEKKGAKHQRNS